MTLKLDSVQAPGGAACVLAKLHHRVDLHPDPLQRGGDPAEAATL